MKFANPQMIWLVLVTVPLLAWFLWWAWRRKQALIAQFVQSRLLAQLTVGVAPLRQKIRLGLLVVAVAGALLALAQHAGRRRAPQSPEPRQTGRARSDEAGQKRPARPGPFCRRGVSPMSPHA